MPQKKSTVRKSVRDKGKLKTAKQQKINQSRNQEKRYAKKLAREKADVSNTKNKATPESV